MKVKLQVEWSTAVEWAQGLLGVSSPLLLGICSVLKVAWIMFPCPCSTLFCLPMQQVRVQFAGGVTACAPYNLLSRGVLVVGKSCAS